MDLNESSSNGQAGSTDASGLRERLIREMGPVGVMQTILAEQVALGVTRLARADAVEDPEDPAWVRRHAQAERSFYRALTEFRRQVKADAKARPEEASATVGAPTPTPRTATADPATDRRPRPERAAVVVGPSAFGGGRAPAAEARPVVAAGVPASSRAG